MSHKLLRRPFCSIIFPSSDNSLINFKNSYQAFNHNSNCSTTRECPGEYASAVGNVPHLLFTMVAFSLAHLVQLSVTNSGLSLDGEILLGQLLAHFASWHHQTKASPVLWKEQASVLQTRLNCEILHLSRQTVSCQLGSPQFLPSSLWVSGRTSRLQETVWCFLKSNLGLHRTIITTLI